MKSYNWNKQKIISSRVLPDNMKKILLCELKETKDEMTAFTKTVAPEVGLFDKYKEIDSMQKSRLKEYSSSLYDFSMNFYKNCFTKTNTYISKNSALDINAELLVDELGRLIELLDDEDITREFNTIFNDDREFVRIKERNIGNSAITNLNGKCVSNPYSDDSYLSVYTRKDYSDFIHLAHETGHALEHRLSYKSKSPIIQTFLFETSSYLMELLMTYYIGNKLDLPTTALMLESNRTTDIMDEGWNLLTIKYMEKELNFNPDIVNEKMNKLGRATNISEQALPELTRTTSLYSICKINSYMLAVELFYKIMADKEKGLYTWKQLINDPEECIEELLNKYDLNYFNNQDNYQKMYSKALGLKKMYFE